MKLNQEAIHRLTPQERIRPFGEIPDLIRQLGHAGLNVFLVQGVFDIVHAGHIGLLRATLGLDPANGVIVLGLENDETVRRNKGDRRPVNPLDDRLQVMAEFRSVAYAFGYEDTPDYFRPEGYVPRWRKLREAAIIAPTWDPHRDLKQWQADEAGAQLALVNYQHENSTTRMLQRVGYEE